MPHVNLLEKLATHSLITMASTTLSDVATMFSMRLILAIRPLPTFILASPSVIVVFILDAPDSPTLAILVTSRIWRARPAHLS
jgi:hypothetical protein